MLNVFFLDTSLVRDSGDIILLLFGLTVIQSSSFPDPFVSLHKSFDLASDLFVLPSATSNTLLQSYMA